MTPVANVEGFLPGEQLAICLLLGLSTADQTGRLPHPLPSWVSGDMVIAGRQSSVLRLVSGSPTA